VEPCLESRGPGDAVNDSVLVNKHRSTEQAHVVAKKDGAAPRLLVSKHRPTEQARVVTRREVAVGAHRHVLGVSPWPPVSSASSSSAWRRRSSKLS